MIAGDRVALRAWSRADLTFLKWFNDPDVTVWAGDPYPSLSLEQEERYYDSHAADETLYSIWTWPEGILIGECGLFDKSTKNSSAEVGITIGEKDYWSQGYGRETLALLLEIGFLGLGLNRIHLRHVDCSERAHRCFLAAGFWEEGRLKQATFIRGKFRDVVLMSVLVEDYAALREGSKTDPMSDGSV